MTPLKLFNIDDHIGILNFNIDFKHFQLYHMTQLSLRVLSNSAEVFVRNYTMAETGTI